MALALILVLSTISWVISILIISPSVPAKDSMADSVNPSYQSYRYSNKAVRRLPVWKWNPNSGFCATWQYFRETSLRRVSMNTTGGLESGECT